MYSDYRKKVAALLREFRAEAVGRENVTRIDREYAQRFDYQFDEQRRHDYNKGTTVPGSYRSQPHRPIRFYIMMTDPAFGMFVNDAKEKAKTRFALNEKYWFHEYIVDVAAVSIRMLGRICFIRMTPADAFYFEFASSAWPIQMSTATQLGITFDMYNGVHVGVHVGLVEGKMIATPTIREQRRSIIGGSDTSINERPYQVQLINEPVAHPFTKIRVNRLRASSALYSSFAPAHAHTGVHTRSTTLGGSGIATDRGSVLPHIVRDIGFDVPYQDSEGISPIRVAFIRTDADWPRENAKLLVENDEFGSRMFGIFADAYNQFHIFPTAAIEALHANPYEQNVPTNKVIMVTPSLPAWCYKQTAKANALNPDDWGNGYWQVDQPEPEWVFRHDGKRAVSIFYERVLWTRDNALFDSPDGTGAEDPFTQADFEAMRNSMGLQSRWGLLFAPGHNENRYYAAPGIIELEFVIEINGPDLEDFTAQVNVREVRRPTTSPYCSMYVGYVWYDVPFGAKVKKDSDGNILEDQRIAKVGDLISYDIEYYYDNLTTGERNGYALGSFKRIDEDLTETEILTTYAFGRVLAMDIRSLSYVMQMRERLEYLGPAYGGTNSGVTRPYKTGAPGGGTQKNDVPWFYWEFAAIVYIGGQYKECLFPNTMIEEKKNTVRDYFELHSQTPLGFRTRMKTWWMDLEPEGQRVYLPLNGNTNWSTAFGTTTFGHYRLSRLTFFGDLVGPHNIPPADEAHWVNFMGNALWTYSYPGQHLYTATPMCEWAAYQDMICNHHDISVNCTFFVHPSGSWAFWRNLDIYNPEGMNYVANETNNLDGWEANILEHVIFDRVHFEIRTQDMVLGKHDSSFQELYNRAVRRGKRAGTLEANIEEITDTSLRARFEKEIYTYPASPPANLTLLRIKCIWDSGVMYYVETGIQGGPYFESASPFPPQQGGMLGLTMDAPWAFSQNWYSSNFGYPSLEDFHVRFCNAIILQAKPSS